VKGVILILSKEIAVVVPRTLAEIPLSYNLKPALTKKEENKEANDKCIKEIF